MAPTYVRHTAEIEGDFVVFLIGAHVAKPWRLLSVLKVVRAMNAMMKELETQPEGRVDGVELSWKGHLRGSCDRSGGGG